MDPFSSNLPLVKIYNATPFTFDLMLHKNPPPPDPDAKYNIITYFPDKNFRPVRVSERLTDFHRSAEKNASDALCIPILKAQPISYFSGYGLENAQEWIEYIEEKNSSKRHSQSEKMAVIVDHDVILRLPHSIRSSCLIPLRKNEKDGGYQELFSSMKARKNALPIKIYGFVRLD
jgi:hypothetical protein